MQAEAARPSLSVVMPVYNGLHFLRESLPPLLAASETEPVPIEVLVVDDGSVDGSADFAREHGARVIASGGRLGPAGARNVAVREARGPVVLFVDADVVVHADAVDRVLKAFANPNTVAVFGAYDDRPTDQRFSSQYMNLRHHHLHQQPSEDAETFWAGLGAVRRDAFLAVGGFDAARYPIPSIEDIDLGRRLRAAGGRLRRVPAIRGTHLKRWTLRGVVYTDIVRRGLPWARLMMEHPGAFTDLNVGAVERLRAAVALGLWVSVAVAMAGVSPAWVPLVVFVAAVGANWELAAVFARAGGWWLAARAILFHQAYYLYGGVLYAFAFVRHRLGLTP